MKYITLNNLTKNTEIISSFDIRNVECSMKVACSSFFSVYADNKVVFYGPERAPEGFSRIASLSIPKGTKKILIDILYYGIPTFDLDEQEFFFGLELLNNGKTILETDSLLFYRNNAYLSDSIRYSFQRGFIERYDLTNDSLTKLKAVLTNSPKELESNIIKCSYKEMQSTLIESNAFTGFKATGDRKYLQITKDDNCFDFDSAFKEITKENYKYSLYKIDSNKSGLIKLIIENGNKDDKVYVYFDECLIDGKIVYGRGTVTNIIEITLNGKKECVISNSIYCAQYFMVIYKNDAHIIPSLISVENENAVSSVITKDENISLILESSKNTYMQNSYDLFTDCPGRERAGWLCDSYFIGMGERYFSSSNNIEKHFLENFIIGKCPEIHNDKIVPMSFPSTHNDRTFIPNWALWFILEINRYYKDTNDINFVNKAKDKILSIIDFFVSYENELGLVENLPSWVFIEWSEAGTHEYVKGINFPTNMTYASALHIVSSLYAIPEYEEKSNKLIKMINKLSFDGNFYHDNAVRDEKNNVCVIKNHISETAQYYAIFFNITVDHDFINKMINNFSSLKKANENGMPKSNVFIGNFLRFLILLKNKEYKLLINEIVAYFTPMAVKTKTLWEKDTDDASCNHGLNAAVAPIIAECLKNL